MSSSFTGGLSLWDAEVKAVEKKVCSKKAECNKECDKAAKCEKASKCDKITTCEKVSKCEQVNSAGLTAANTSTRVVIGERSKWPAPLASSLSLEDRYERIMSVGAECIQPEELKALLARKANPVCYDGFEPSGRMHVAQGLLKAINVNKLTSSGCEFVFWIADWFAVLNNKMGGDLKKVQKVGEYFIEVWKAVGMDMTNVRFLWASDEINANSNDYWVRVMDVARSSTISRVKRCGQIMGRQEGDDQPAAQIMYPCMQCADIFHLKVDICQLGIDQRKVNMLARDYCDTKGIKTRPIVLSHAMIPGLLEGQEKASKSNPESAIFMEDSPQDVARKIKRSFCPPQIVEGNPVIEHIVRLVFPIKKIFEISRTEANGGDISFDCEKKFLEAYKDGSLHPGDVKAALVKNLNDLLQPVRDHFKNDPHARELLKQISAYKITK